MHIKRFMIPVNLTLGVCFSCISIAPYLWLAPADANSTTSSIQNKQEYSQGSVPGRWRGGGRRGTCPDVQTPLTAIVPYTELPSQGLHVTYVGGVTVAEHPTLWFYVPYTLNAELTADFILQDKAGNTVEMTPISSKDFPASERSPGLVKVALPALKVDEGYQWYFKINCETESPIYVQGGIERIPLSPALTSQLASATPQQQARIYQNNNLIYDAINILGNLHREHPSDTAITTVWNELLRSLKITGVPTTLNP